MANPFDDYEVVGTYKPPSKSSQNLFKDFEYVSDIPTVSGQFQEGGTRFLRDVGTSSVAVPLKGASIFETFREKIVDKGLRDQIEASFERAKNPIRPGDRTNAVRDLRRVANLYLDKDERKELWDIASKLEKGEVEVPELEKEAKEKLPFYVPPKAPEERTAYKAGERVEKFLKEKLPTTPGYENTLGVQVGGALGSTAGSIAQSLVGGPVTLFAGSALQGIEEQYERATKSGLKGQEAVDYAIQGAGPGALGMLSTEYILRKVPKAVRGKMLQHLTDIGVTGTAEAMMEATQEAIQNAIEMQYNKDRDVLDGTPFAAGTGFTAGAIIRGIILSTMRGKGVSGSADGGQIDPAQVQRELAAEELRIRQEGTADAETHEPGKPSPKAKSPLEAAQKGEVKAPGRPVNVVHNGQRYNGYIRNETPDGGYEIVDQDGVVSILEPGEAVVNDGWKERKSDADIEKTLKEWLDGEIPWPKVTVTTPEGTLFKAIEGPPVEGKRTFKDAYGKTHQFDAESIAVDNDWDAEAEDEPMPSLGEVAKAQEKVAPVTEEDKASPLPTDLIAAGKRESAAGEGTQKANTILSKAGIPPIGTEVMVGGEKFIIQDASDDTVEILNSAGVINRRNIGEIAPEIGPIPAKEAAKPGVERTAPRTSVPEGAETDIPLPSFIGPKGRRVLTEPTKKPGEKIPEVKITAAPEATIETPKGVVVPKEDITVAGEVRTGTPPTTDIQPPAFLSEPRTGLPSGQDVPESKIEKPIERTAPRTSLTAREDRTEGKAGEKVEAPVQRTEPRTEIPSGAVKDDQREREESRIGGEGREGAGDKAKHGEGKASAAQAGIRDTKVQRAARPEIVEKEKVDAGQTERQVQPEGKKPEPTSEVRKAEGDGGTTRRTYVGENEPDEGQGTRVRQETISEGGPPPSSAQPVQPAPIPAQEGTQRTAGRWWDEAPEETKRKALRQAGYSSEPEQRRKLLSQPWSDLPPVVKTGLTLKNAKDIKSYVSATPETTVNATKAAAPEISVADAKAQGMSFRKSGAPFDSPTSAMLTFKPETHEPVKVEGGWAVMAKGQAQPSPETEITTPPVTKQAEPKVKPLKQEIPYVKQNDVYLNKDGKGWGRKADASSVAKTLGKGFTVTEDDSGKVKGWIVKPKPEAKPAPQTKVEKAKPAATRRITKKEYDAKRAAVNASLRGELDKMGLKDVDLSTPDKLGDVEGSKSIDDSKVAVGRSRSNLIEVALSPERDYRKTLRHEAVHAMRNLGLFKDAEWKTLERDAKADRELMADVKERYAGESLTDEAVIEEAIADKFADYVDGFDKPSGFVRAAFEKIKKFIRALGNALRGNGFRTSGDVFQSMESGEIGARPRGAVTRLETKSQIARAEAAADDALRELRDPGAGLVDPDMRSRIKDGDEFFVDDIGKARKWMISPRTIAAFNPSFAPVYVTAKHQFGFRDKIISDLGNTYKPYQQLKRDSKNKVNKVLELGRLNSKVYKPEADGTITVTTDKQTATMKAGESVTLNAKEVEAYQSVRSMMDTALGFFRDQTVRDFGFDHTQIKTPKDALALIGPKTPPSVRDKIQTLAKMMTDIQQSERTGYVPFTRFGNVVVTAKRMNEASGQYETVHSETVEVKGLSGRFKRLIGRDRIDGVKEIRQLKKDLAKRYPGADIKAFQVASREDNRPDTDKDMLTELLQLPPDQVAAAIQKMHKDALSKGFRKHFFGAKNVPGYSGDIERSIADYVISIGGFIARRESHNQWEQSINAIPSNMPRLKEYAQNYREYTNTPSEEFAHLRQAGFIYYLAGNFSNAALNLTQVPMVAAPYMSMFGNEARVSFEIGRAYKDTLKMVGGGKGEIFNPNKAPPDVRAALQKAWKEGQFTPLAMFDIMGVAYNRNQNMRSLSAGLREVTEWVALPQTSTERMNRVVTFIAAYRLANKNPEAFRAKAFNVLKDNALAADVVLQNYSPEAFARHVVDETQYDVGKINRAVFMRGVGAPLFQFKSFLTNTLELHYKLGTLHGKQGIKAVGMMWMGLVATAGLWGIPFSEDATDIGEALYKWWTGLDIDVRTELRETMVELTGSPNIAQLITNGSTRALGLDMTNRIGLGKVAPRTTLEAGGVPASLLYGQTSKAFGHLKEGRIVEGMGELSPLFLKNPITAMQWHNTGIRTMYGDPVFTPDEVTAGDIAAKTLGFTPAKVAERRAMEWAQQRAGKATQDLKTKYYRKMARAIIDMNDAESDEAFMKVNDRFMAIIDEIQAHNDRAIDDDRYHEIIEIDDRALERRVMAEITGRGAVREQTAPKVARPRVQELREIYGANP